MRQQEIAATSGVSTRHVLDPRERFDRTVQLQSSCLASDHALVGDIIETMIPDHRMIIDGHPPNRHSDIRREFSHPQPPETARVENP